MIHQKFGPMDLALLPIGAYEPRWFMKEFHMDPADAVQAHLDLQSKLSVGIHFGTFQLTDEGIDAPVHDLEAALMNANIPSSHFIAPLLGQTIFV
jgi:L-ascorbate metabolism protein UlaG (beta-lactamase superfamily)